MGSPDGGWYDETPPYVVSSTPDDGGTNVSRRHILINFNEYIKLDNPTENVIISPPQLQQAEVKAEGKRISVQLLDSLKPNTTYTVDFSSAISDNNEGNPMGNYTYTFSTGDHIDTLEVSGYVLNAENLEPVKGILVGLYDNLSDTAFQRQPMLRVSKTDSRGRFSVKGVAPGTYRIYALQDADGDFTFGQKSEMLAFQQATVTPTCKPDIRQDTTWTDSLHIASIERVTYTHFLPDNVCLRAFNEVLTNRYLLKTERQEANHFTLFYTYGDSILPVVRGLNFNSDNAFIVEPSAKNDTITYWLRDTTLVNQDTLTVELTHDITDSLGVLRQQTDTVTLLSKKPYARRMREAQKQLEQWQKDQQRKKKRGEPYDSIMPPEELKLSITPSGDMDPDQNVTLVSPEPLRDVDTTAVHLYSHQKGDSLWYPEPMALRRVNAETYLVRAAWKPEMEYSLEADSAAFATIYGKVAGPIKTGLRVRSNDSYATLLMSISGLEGKHLVVQLLNGSDKVVKQAFTDNGQAEFYYLKGGKYYMRLIVDDNDNHLWDTGDFDTGRQPEMVYYYPEEIECRAKWDLTLSWNPTAKPLYEQKPARIVQQKADKQKTVQHRNQDRAKRLGIEYIPK